MKTENRKPIVAAALFASVLGAASYLAYVTSVAHHQSMIGWTGTIITVAFSGLVFSLMKVQEF